MCQDLFITLHRMTNAHFQIVWLSCLARSMATSPTVAPDILPYEYTASPIGRNSGVLNGGEPHQNSVSRVSSNSGGFCAAKTGFDGLSSVALVRFCSNFRKAPGISSYRRNRTLWAPRALNRRVQNSVFLRRPSKTIYFHRSQTSFGSANFNDCIPHGWTASPLCMVAVETRLSVHVEPSGCGDGHCPILARGCALTNAQLCIMLLSTVRQVFGAMCCLCQMYRQGMSGGANHLKTWGLRAGRPM
jgi:hypothetical protein